MKKINALSEFIHAVGTFEKVLCSEIIFTDHLGDTYTFILKVGHTQKEFISFLRDINIYYSNNIYDSIENIDGIIWITKDSYYIREKYNNKYLWKFEINNTIADHLK